MDKIVNNCINIFLCMLSIYLYRFQYSYFFTDIFAEEWFSLTEYTSQSSIYRSPIQTWILTKKIYYSNVYILFRCAVSRVLWRRWTSSSRKTPIPLATLAILLQFRLSGRHLNLVLVV